MIDKLKQRTARALRWSEKYTKTDMLYLTKGGFWVGLEHGFVMISGLILAVAFANLLPKEAYGTYQFIMAVAAVIAAFTLTGMTTAITRAVARGSEGALRYGFKIRLVWSIGIAIAAAVVSLYYYINDNTTLATAFLIVGAFMPFFEGFGLYKPYLVGKKLFRESALLGFWRRPLPIIALITTLFLTQDPVILVLVYFASHTLTLGTLFFLTLRRYNPPATPDPDLVNYSKHLSVMEIIGRLANNADKILIFHFLGAAPVAIYFLALLPIKQMQNVFGLTRDLTIPKLSNRDFATLQKTLTRKALFLFLIAAIVTGVYILVAPFLFSVFFPEYPESVIFTQTLALLLLASPARLFRQAFIAHQKKRELYILRIGTPLLRAGLLVVSIPLYGVGGAVTSLVIAAGFGALISILLFYTQ